MPARASLRSRQANENSAWDSPETQWAAATTLPNAGKYTKNGVVLFQTAGPGRIKPAGRSHCPPLSKGGLVTDGSAYRHTLAWSRFPRLARERAPWQTIGLSRLPPF